MAFQNCPLSFAIVCSRFLLNQYPYAPVPFCPKKMICLGERSHRCEKPMVSLSEDDLNMVEFILLCERLAQDIIPP